MRPKIFLYAVGSSVIKAEYLSTLQFSKLVDIQSQRLQSSLFISILSLNCTNKYLSKMEYCVPGEGNMEEFKFPTGQMNMKEEGRNLWQGKT